MRRCGGIKQLLVVTLAAADAQILLLAGHRFESIHIVLPLLHSDKTAAQEFWVLAQGSLLSVFCFGVFGAIFVSGQIPIVAVSKAINSILKLEIRC